MHGRLSNWAYRFKLVLNDWAEVRSGRKNLNRFILDRKTLRRIIRPFAGKAAVEDSAPSAEQYDRWLVEYLNRMIEAYAPDPLEGKMTVFRSEQEPAGWFLDPKLGWERLLKGPVDLVVVSGDHYTAFQEPGVSTIADNIKSVMATLDDVGQATGQQSSAAIPQHEPPGTHDELVCSF